MYLTFERYVELGGRVSREAFPPALIRAEALLGEWTSGRLATWPGADAVVEAALASMVDAVADGGGRPVKSFSNGASSFTFSDQGAAYGDLYERVCELLPCELIGLAVE